MYYRIDLYQVFLVIHANKKYIILFSGLITFVVAILVYFATPIYTAQVTIKPVQLIGSGANTGLSFEDLQFLVELGAVSIRRNDLDVTTGLLRSDSVREILIKQFNLQNHYELSDLGVTKQYLASNTEIVPDTKLDFLDIYVDDKDPKLASDIANYYAIALGKVVSNMLYPKNNNALEFSKRQILMANNSLAISQNKLNDFIYKNGILSGQQLKNYRSLSVQLQNNLVTERNKLEVASFSMTSKNFDYQKISSVMNNLDNLLSNISGKVDEDSLLAISARLAPDLAYEYRELFWQNLLNAEILRRLNRLYIGEQINNMDLKYPVDVVVVDPATKPLYKSKPKFFHSVWITLWLSIICSCICFMVINYRQVVILS